MHLTLKLKCTRHIAQLLVHNRIQYVFTIQYCYILGDLPFVCIKDRECDVAHHSKLAHL